MRPSRPLLIAPLLLSCSAQKFCSLTHCPLFCCRTPGSTNHSAAVHCCADCRLALPTIADPSPSCGPNVALIVSVSACAVVLVALLAAFGVAVYRGRVCADLADRGESGGPPGAIPQRGRNSVSSYPACANYPTMQTRGFAAAERYAAEAGAEKAPEAKSAVGLT